MKVLSRPAKAFVRAILGFGLFSLAVVPGHVSYAGNENSGGGEFTAQAFAKSGWAAYGFLEKTGIQPPEISIDLEKLRTALGDTRVVATDEDIIEEVDGEQVKMSAWYYEDKKKIRFNRRAFSQASKTDQEMFVLHEYLRASGYRDENYRISGPIMVAREEYDAAIAKGQTPPAVSAMQGIVELNGAWSGMSTGELFLAGHSILDLECVLSLQVDQSLSNLSFRVGTDCSYPTSELIKLLGPSGGEFGTNGKIRIDEDRSLVLQSYEDGKRDGVPHYDHYMQKIGSISGDRIKIKGSYSDAVGRTSEVWGEIVRSGNDLILDLKFSQSNDWVNGTVQLKAKLSRN